MVQALGISWIDLLQAAFYVATTVAITLGLPLLNKWRGIKATGEEQRQQSEALIQAVLAEEQKAFARFKREGVITTGSEKKSAAIATALSLNPKALAGLDDRALDAKLEAAVATISQRPPPMFPPVSMKPPRTGFPSDTTFLDVEGRAK